MNAEETRDELLESVARWRRLLPSEGQWLTWGTGVAMRANTLTALLLKEAVAELLPGAEIRDRPTLGDYVGVLERFGRKARLACSASGRRMLTPTELQLLHRLSRRRARVAHAEVHEEREGRDVGRLPPTEIAEILDLVERVAALPLIQETICRQRARRRLREGLPGIAPDA